MTRSVTHAAVEQAPTPDASQASTDRYVKRLSAGVANALNNARRDGSIRPDVDIEAQGHYLAATLLGLFVMIRAKVGVEVLDNAVRQAIAQVDALAP